MGLNNKQVARHTLFNYLTLLHNILIMLLSLCMAAHKEHFLSKLTSTSPKWRDRTRKQWLLPYTFWITGDGLKWGQLVITSLTVSHSYYGKTRNQTQGWLPREYKLLRTTPCCPTAWKQLRGVNSLTGIKSSRILSAVF